MEVYIICPMWELKKDKGGEVDEYKKSRQVKEI